MSRVSLLDEFGSMMYKSIKDNENAIIIMSDSIKGSNFNRLKEMYGERIISIENAEQNMFAIAAGVASVNNAVFVLSHSAFISLRACEQIRTLIAFPKLNVKIISGLAGLSDSYRGVVYQGMEDVGIMRGIPNMAVIVPADIVSAAVIFEQLNIYRGPAYIRLGYGQMPKIFDGEYKFRLGEANIIKGTGTDAAIICNGIMLGRVIDAEKKLSNKGYKVQIIEMPSVKPIDEELIIKTAKATGAIITVEEHSIIGGLGSAVAEVISENFPVLIKRIGIRDIFTESGCYKKILDKYGLSVLDIVNSVEDIINKKDHITI